MSYIIWNIVHLKYHTKYFEEDKWKGFKRGNEFLKRKRIPQQYIAHVTVHTVHAYQQIKIYHDPSSFDTRSKLII